MRVVNLSSVLFCLAACRRPNADPSGLSLAPEPPVRTSTEAYATRLTGGTVDITVPVTYTNRGSEAVYVARCGFVLERSDGERWVLAHVPVCGGPAPRGSQRDRVAPGDTLARMLRVVARTHPRSVPRWETGPGVATYRAVLLLYGSDRGPEQLPAAAGRSNTFRIEVAGES